VLLIPLWLPLAHLFVCFELAGDVRLVVGNKVRQELMTIPLSDIIHFIYILFLFLIFYYILVLNLHLKRSLRNEILFIHFSSLLPGILRRQLVIKHNTSILIFIKQLFTSRIIVDFPGASNVVGWVLLYFFHFWYRKAFVMIRIILYCWFWMSFFESRTWIDLFVNPAQLW